MTVAGFVAVVAGITLVLAWWPDVVHFFKGILGMALAVAGLVILTLIKD